MRKPTSPIGDGSYQKLILESTVVVHFAELEAEKRGSSGASTEFAPVFDELAEDFSKAKKRGSFRRSWAGGER
jgi:hypothetical protein